MKTETQNQKTVMLPREVSIDLGAYWKTQVRNHKVISGPGFFRTSASVCGTSIWDKFVKQMKQQGITFEIFQQQCITEITDVEKLSKKEPIITSLDASEYQKISAIIVKKIQGCTSWGNYNGAVAENGKFRKDITKKINAGIVKRMERIVKKKKKGGNKS